MSHPNQWMFHAPEEVNFRHGGEDPNMGGPHAGGSIVDPVTGRRYKGNCEGTTVQSVLYWLFCLFLFILFIAFIYAIFRFFCNGNCGYWGGGRGGRGGCCRRCGQSPCSCGGGGGGGGHGSGGDD